MKKTVCLLLLMTAGAAGCTPQESQMIADMINTAAGIHHSQNTYRPQRVNVYNPPRPAPIHIPVNTITPNPTDSGKYGGIGGYESRCRTRTMWTCGTR